MEQIIKADYAQAVKAIKQAIVVCRYRAARQMNGEVFEIHSAVPNEFNIAPQSAENQPFTFRSTLLTKLISAKCSPLANEANISQCRRIA